MTCNEAIEQFHEFLDNELDETNYSNIRQHIDLCHKCCEKFEFEQAIKRTVKEKTQIHKTPQHLLQSIKSQWAELNEGRSRPEPSVVESKRTFLDGIFGLFTLRPAYVTMAVLLPMTIIGLAAYLAFFRPVEYSPIVKVAAERHDSFVNNNMHLDLVSSDSNEIRRHFQNLQRSNPAIDVPEFNGREMELLGCKDYSRDGRKSAYVGLRGNQNKISLEMANGSGIDMDKLPHKFFKGRTYYFARYNGYNVVMWKHGNTLYSLTSTMNREGLMRVASETILSYNK
ncbi:anti-sigma factor [Candidatus Scalindua japonica]|uniref:Anti-sigma factor n=1 Tax=Candidatus Scalindua japonica TaxID=1284222 RepID=A0A286TWP7_9BACT|nr:zf-HC2 domain-containing protein [Candidatus Scalindua japonica]GAX60317.1 anti-sigma factor [Candidatus Scalindua japonica]